MKKLLFLSMLISAVSGFAAAPVPMVAPENAPIEPQIFHLCKEALERMAYESEKGYLSQEEIEDVLKKEMAVIVQHANKARFEKYIHYEKFIDYDGGGCIGKTLQSFVLIWGSVFGAEIALEAVLKRFNPGTLGQNLLRVGAFGLAIIAIHGFPSQCLPCTMIKKYRIEKEWQKTKAESYAILDPEKFDYWPFSRAGFLNKMSLKELSRLFFCDFNNLSSNEQGLAREMLQSLQKLYPTKYPDINSLRLKQLLQGETAALIYLGFQERRNAEVNETLHKLLAKRPALEN